MCVYALYMYAHTHTHTSIYLYIHTRTYILKRMCFGSCIIQVDSEGPGARADGLTVRVPCPTELIKTQTKKGGGGGGFSPPMQCSWCGAHKEV